jgi:small subunit ribosomal protein S9
MPTKKAQVKHFFEGVGRRKTAVAVVRLYLPNKEKTAMIFGHKVKQGEMIVNKKPVEKYFSSASDKASYLLPLRLTKSDGRFAISAIIRGGGPNGQLEAFTHGLARALEKVDKESYRPVMKKEGLMTRDARIRERRKVGTGGKARRAKQSPKR